MKAQDYLVAARVPQSLQPQLFGLWEIERRQTWQAIERDGEPIDVNERSAFERVAQLRMGRFGDYTLLRRWTDKSIHLERGEIVMEDSESELRRHLPIWLAASGRVLKTGLGLGCVVRGLLAKSEVDHIDVVEIDSDIIRVIGAEFASEPRVTIHHADALSWAYGSRTWDYAWHDLHSFGEAHLQVMHCELIARFLDAVPLHRQGAWAMPRWVSRSLPERMLGAPRP